MKNWQHALQHALVSFAIIVASALAAQAVVSCQQGPAVSPGALAQRRAQLEAYEDRFCATVASARKLEAATGLLPDAGK